MTNWLSQSSISMPSKRSMTLAFVDFVYFELSACHRFESEREAEPRPG
jgi:hypothetical protein